MSWQKRLPEAPDQSSFLPYLEHDAEIGRLLFFDPILSGNLNISCATCHHPHLGTSDGLSLGIGEGGRGIGPERSGGESDARVKKRVPRNASALFNLGARDIHTLFHDGRLSLDDHYGNGFNSPAEEWLPNGLDNLLAAQALFPLVAQFEMAGNLGENEIIGAVHDRIDAAWPIIASRVAAIDAYAEHFIEHDPAIRSRADIDISAIANAIAAFINSEWRHINSPFDRYLRGEHDALDAEAQAGMALFYGKGGCSDCHSGPWLSDQQFHALGLPAFGPGRTRRFDLIARDLGHQVESDRIEDAYAFRTPMLRNVAKTAPYGHNGAYPTLEGIVRHHLDPAGMRAGWTPAMARLPDLPWLADSDFQIRDDRLEMARQARFVPEQRIQLDDREIDALIAFLEALSDESAPPTNIPLAVPSGLAVDALELSTAHSPGPTAQSHERRSTP